MKKSVLKLSLVFTGVAMAMNLNAQTVTNGNDDNSEGSLRKEIADTPDGGTVTILPLVMTVNLNSELFIDKNITITCTPGVTTINAGVNGRAFNVDGKKLTITNLTITNGQAADGGAIQVINNGNLNLTSVTITNSTANGMAGSGGAILVASGSKMVATTSNFGNNKANRAGGAIEVSSIVDSALVLVGCIFTSNKAGIAPSTPAPGNGGAIHMTGAGNSYINGGSASANIAALEGGGFWNGTGTMIIEGTLMNQNEAKGAGATEGGGALFNAGGTMIVKNASINDNLATGAAGSGGGILNDLGTLTIESTDLDGNSAVRAGGAIEDNSTSGKTLTILESTITNNIAGAGPGNGGGLHTTGTGSALIKGTTFSTNEAAAEGGAIWNDGGSMVIDSSTIDQNTASGAASSKGGGGIYNFAGTVSIINESTVSNNLADGSSGSGGGILSKAGTISIDNSTIEANGANRAGGGIEIIDGTLTINNSDLTLNDVDGKAGTPAPGLGGAIHVTGINATISIDSSNVTDNLAALAGGGLWFSQGSVVTLNAVWVNANVAGQNGGGIFNSGGTVSVTRSTISANEAGGNNGGGINNNTGIVLVDHSTISTNKAGANGGGIHNADSLFVDASTIVFNETVTNGGGIESTVDSYITNTMISGNLAMLGQEVDGSVISMGYNLIENDDNTVFTALATDTVDVTPLLTGLQQNDGFSPSYAYQAGSVGIERGNPADMSVDQRNRAPYDGRRDIGAVEYTANLSVAENTASDIFSVYPNPATDNVTILLENGVSGAVVVYDLNGKSVLSSTVSGASTINVAGLNTGMYLMTVSTENGTQTRKLQVK